MLHGARGRKPVLATSPTRMDVSPVPFLTAHHGRETRQALGAAPASRILYSSDAVASPSAGCGPWPPRSGARPR